MDNIYFLVDKKTSLTNFQFCEESYSLLNVFISNKKE